ncbi:type II toxin-antitoxin system mRNA interferase toxin, RelE/StbE family [Candidatus Berkelbacteria bacterium]|nr:type II toxin-antitoxin system mRNA interferase toxin, RelE/StbE family [Candidatus Berkelbacteria bacterium]
MIEIQYSPRFLQEFRRLDKSIQRRFETRETWFRKDPNDARLRTHSLKGNLRGYWAFSVTASVRAVFTFEPSHRIRFHRIGTHDQVYRSSRL